MNPSPGGAAQIDHVPAGPQRSQARNACKQADKPCSKSTPGYFRPGLWRFIVNYARCRPRWRENAAFSLSHLYAAFVLFDLFRP